MCNSRLFTEWSRTNFRIFSLKWVKFNYFVFFLFYNLNSIKSFVVEMSGWYVNVVNSSTIFPPITCSINSSCRPTSSLSIREQRRKRRPNRFFSHSSSNPCLYSGRLYISTTLKIWYERRKWRPVAKTVLEMIQNRTGSPLLKNSYVLLHFLTPKYCSSHFGRK